VVCSNWSSSTSKLLILLPTAVLFSLWGPLLSSFLPEYLSIMIVYVNVCCCFSCWGFIGLFLVLFCMRHYCSYRVVGCFCGVFCMVLWILHAGSVVVVIVIVVNVVLVVVSAAVVIKVFTAVAALIYSKATISPVLCGVFSLKWPILWDVRRPMWAREHCRISPPRFLAECRKRRVNQGSFVLLCFVLFAFSGLCLVCVSSVFLICLLSCILQNVPAWIAPA